MTTMAAAVLLAVGMVGLAATPAWAAPPANDNFANATPVTLPFTDALSTTEATTEAGEQGSCGFNPFRSVWYALTPTSSGTATIDTIGSGFDTVLTVYTGSSVSDLTFVTCDNNGAPLLTSRVTFSVTASTTYYIKVDGATAASGDLVINGTFRLANPPANDNFADATPVTLPFTDAVNTTDATAEAGEPDGCVVPSFNGVWYALTTVGSGTATVDTFGSDFDTVLDVFTGSSLTDLTLVTCNDDFPGHGLESSVTFSVAASTTYYIRAGALGNAGNLVITGNFQPASSPDLTTTVSDSADPVALGGDNLTYTVVVVNNGTAASTGGAVTTTLSGASATIVSASSTQFPCTISAPTVTCPLNGLAVSQSATITVAVSPNATGTVTATAVSTLNETDANPADNTDAESTTVNNALGCTIVGTAGNDTLNGTNNSDVLCGLGGNDTIDGKNGDDTLYGGDGDDIMGGGNGADTLYGGAGNDANYGETLLEALLFLFDNGNDHIYGGAGDDDLDGQNGNDTLLDTQGTDTMSGGLGTDSINVQDGTGGDTANGGLGTDTCTTDPTDTTTSC